MSVWPQSQTIAVLGARLTDDGEKDVRLAAVADHSWWCCVVSIMLGLWSGLIIGHITGYYTSHSYNPGQEIAETQKQSAATGIIYGLALVALAGSWCSIAVPAVEDERGAEAHDGRPAAVLLHRRGQDLPGQHVHVPLPLAELSDICVDFHMDGGPEGVVRPPEGRVSSAPRPSCTAHPATVLLIADYGNALRCTPGPGA